MASDWCLGAVAMPRRGRGAIRCGLPLVARGYGDADVDAHVACFADVDAHVDALSQLVAPACLLLLGSFLYMEARWPAQIARLASFLILVFINF